MIKILSATQIREAEQYSITHIPIRSIDLMELAAMAFSQSFMKQYSSERPVMVFCGGGNNGGDGLAIARILLKKNYKVSVFLLGGDQSNTADFLSNKAWLDKISEDVMCSVNDYEGFPKVPEDAIIVDALFGTGLNRSLSGLIEKLVSYLNQQAATRVAVDIPSGLFADRVREGVVFHAHYTITFQQPKLAFLFPENEQAAGKWETVPIGLDTSFIQSLPSFNALVERADVKALLKTRSKFDHKGRFGHAFIHAGNAGKTGAAILCAAACARTGAGLTTLHIPEESQSTINIAIPEVMTLPYSRKGRSDYNSTSFSAAAFGPGIGTDSSAAELFMKLLKKTHVPSVFDADALNIISADHKGLSLLPKNSIITPHLKEFERLAGSTGNWMERHQKQVTLSGMFGIYIVLKGAYTCITAPDGMSYFNPTGNPAMAKGGSGDVLTGIIAGLLAQHYAPLHACLLGVFLHGHAGDLAVKKHSAYSLLATDIIATIGDAYQDLATGG